MDFTFNADNPAVRCLARQWSMPIRGQTPKAVCRQYLDPAAARPAQRIPPRSRHLALSPIAGTFKEREGFQRLPNAGAVAGRIVRCSSNRWTSYLIRSAAAARLTAWQEAGTAMARFRVIEGLRAADSSSLEADLRGRSTDGAADPATSAPSTAKPLRPAVADTWGSGPNRPRHHRRLQEDAQGLSADQPRGRPRANAAFLEACKKSGVPGFPVQ